MGDDTNRCSRVFPAALASVPVARQWAGRVLAGWGIWASDFELAFNEMVTNAVVHGTGDVQADLILLGSCVKLEIHDEGGAGPVVPRHAGPDQTNGRGLDLVSRVAASWGWDQPATGGTTVWAVVPRAPPDRP